ncbi:MAG: hypothetical protein RLZZ244_1116 [Verrucomicrobiota bacterium]|jgi:hypothetical protein
MRLPLLAAGLLLLALCPPALCAGPLSLLSHLRSPADLAETRRFTAEVHLPPTLPEATLRLAFPALPPNPDAAREAWVALPPPPEGWSLERFGRVSAQITNTSPAPLETFLWVVGSHGWDAVCDFAKLEPGEARLFSCDLAETFPDRTPKLDPRRIASVQVMCRESGPAKSGGSLEVRRLQASGEPAPFHPPSGRLEVPPAQEGAPAPGKRVFFRLPGDEASPLASVLYLPRDWAPGRRYPVIAEYPGNVFFTKGCYSTGRPEQCPIGYGMTRGEGAIWVCLPFVNRNPERLAENQWGKPDDTAQYAQNVLREITDQFGGDPRNLFLTGFSRGAIACGFIGLRNDSLASLWKGIHACQHFDGDGWGGAEIQGALERARRFAGKAVFYTDNADARLKQLVTEAGLQATHQNSHLGAHACAMFLDDRPSTQTLRAWFQERVQSP